MREVTRKMVCVSCLDGLIWGWKANHVITINILYNNKLYDYIVHAETISHNVPSFPEEPMFMQAERGRQRADSCLDPGLNGRFTSNLGQGWKWLYSSKLPFSFEISNLSSLFDEHLYVLFTFLLKSLCSYSVSSEFSILSHHLSIEVSAFLHFNYFRFAQLVTFNFHIVPRLPHKLLPHDLATS